MASIYNISSWSGATAYAKDDIVKYTIPTNIGGVTTNVQYFFYSLVNGNSNKIPALSSEVWGGIYSLNSIIKPIFLWAPSYNFNINTQPMVRSIRFGDGYEQRVREGLNNALIKIELNFEKRSLKEATAILHFLNERKGVESFVFSAPEPYNIQKAFVSRDWAVSQSFVNNYAINTTFEEVPS